MTLVKICGITNIEDAVAAVECGADMLGFIFADSPRRVDKQTAYKILQTIKLSNHQTIRTIGVFTEESDEVLRIIDECRLDYAQLHGGQSEDFAEKIGAGRVIRVARVKDESSLVSLANHTHAAYYLLDTYKKGHAGGTGETFDWELALRAKLLGKPIILSGGLKPDNIAEAIKRVRPYAVDISSGVELSPGKKDHNKIKELIENVRAANNAS